MIAADHHPDRTVFDRFALFALPPVRLPYPLSAVFGGTPGYHAQRAPVSPYHPAATLLAGR
jgi:hypothetical protein